MNQVLSDRVIDLDATEVHTLGPNLKLERCTIHSHCTTRSLIASDTQMLGGSFNQKKVLRNYPFDRVIFQGVKFTGKYVGCDFGSKSRDLQGQAVDCDFSEARVHDSSVYDCPPDRIGFPMWPRFSIAHPRDARAYVMSQEWPSRLGTAMDVYTDVSPRCTAVFGDASELAKECGIGEAELRARLEKIPGIVIID
jgi:hypothetical protein